MNDWLFKDSVLLSVKDLPAVIKQALKSLKHRGREVRVYVKEYSHLESSYGDGYRAVNAILDLNTGEMRETWGSWGGSNAFVRTPSDDMCDRKIPLPPGILHIYGQEGGIKGNPKLSITVGPGTINRIYLPAAKE